MSGLNFKLGPASTYVLGRRGWEKVQRPTSKDMSPGTVQEVLGQPAEWPQGLTGKLPRGTVCIRRLIVRKKVASSSKKVTFRDLENGTTLKEYETVLRMVPGSPTLYDLGSAFQVSAMPNQSHDSSSQDGTSSPKSSGSGEKQEPERLDLRTSTSLSCGVLEKKQSGGVDTTPTKQSSSMTSDETLTSGQRF